MFRAAQPIPTAAPLFVGMPDPLPCRLVKLPGAERVDPPGAAKLAPPPPPPFHHIGEVLRGRILAAHAPTARLAGLITAVRSAPEGQRHSRLFWAACRAGEMAAAGEVGAKAAATVLAQAAMEAGGRDRRNAEATARHGVLRGMMEGGR